MVAALDEIQQPTATLYRYGIFSAATVIDDTSFDPRGQNYTWRVQGCTPGDRWDYCWAEDYDPDQTKRVLEDEWMEETPFVVFDGVRCPPVGSADLRQVAVQRLALSEQGQVERHLWEQLQDDAIVIGGGATAPFDSLSMAIGALEAQYQAVTGAVGVLHAPRIAAALWQAEGDQVNRDGPAVLRTTLWTPISFGAGYDYTGPDGTATDDVIWVYITGPVTVRRGAVQVYGGEQGGFDRISNEIKWIAERPYLVTVDCVVYAAAVSVPGRPDIALPVIPAGFSMTVDTTDGTVTASFANADCEQVRIAWGDGTTSSATVGADETATAIHDYSAGAVSGVTS